MSVPVNWQGRVSSINLLYLSPADKQVDSTGAQVEEEDMWWFAVVVSAVSAGGLWLGVAGEASPEPDPLVVYAFPSWAAEMFGTPEEVAQATATAMTPRGPVPTHARLPFAPVAAPPSPLLAIRDAQAAPSHLLALQRPTIHNVQLMQRPFGLLPYHYFMPAMHLRVPYAPVIPYDTRYRPPALVYPALPPITYAHSRPQVVDDDDDEDEDTKVEERPTYVRVGHFPTEVAGVFTLRGADDGGPPAPAGIVQSTAPIFSRVPFTNAKAHPSLRETQPADDGAVIAE
ncbi:uncharacterized protein LOC123512538 [Portunus trituberculatus]|uniref:uncharacterized protein LOC123512538 n=1 Tax=Portunus trituberculatus TaxID=210409 RepID=UPI001E1D1428|nr:uncharacterized protein LOC123512538 [Portunus trituberculatus]